MNWVVLNIIVFLDAVGNIISSLVPDVDKSLGFFSSGDKASLVKLVDLFDLSISFSNNILLFRWDKCIADSNSKSSLC